ncbi:hypothetical protein EIP86_000733 [Pleurotus ostreatoroseus]|nr:hypothetical protein EIP86_000733 [Pleurotus ostreatoroseus]
MTKTVIVRPEWLDALISSGSSSDGPSQLEREFVLPDASSFKPKLSPSLPSSLKNYRSWELNDERTNMLSDYRFIFVGERGREAREDLRTLVKYGGSTYECCPVQGGRGSLRTVLAKAESKGKQPVLIGDENALVAAIGKDGFDELVQEAETYEVRFIPSERIVQSVVHINRDYLDSAARKPGAVTQESLPDVILNTVPSEPSTPPDSMEPVPVVLPEQPKRPLVRRTRGPSNPATTPAIESETHAEYDIHPSATSPLAEDPAPGGQRPLVRRFHRGAAAAPAADDSATENSRELDREIFKEPEPIVVSAGTTNPTQPISQPNPGLKRRFTPNGEREPRFTQLSTAFSSYTPPAEEDEPPTKKYKQLFDETDPNKIAKIGLDEYKNMFKNTQSQVPDYSEVSQRSSTGRRPLAAVPEEDEENTQPQAQARDRLESLKRKKPEDVVSQGSEVADKGTKKRAIENVNSVELSSSLPPRRQASTKPSSKPASQTRTKSRAQSQALEGVESNEPDRDEKFLLAVASRKRGKKHEDEYDREFNSLKIAKPTLPEPEDDWSILDELGDDRDLRGNFMVIVDIDVFKKGETPLDPYRVSGSRADWEGRPNFKKFRQASQNIFEEEPSLEVTNAKTATASDRGRYSSYGTQSQMRDDDSDSELAIPGSSYTRTRSAARTASRAASVEVQRQPSQATQSRRSDRIGVTTRAKKSQPLFIESDEDEDEFAAVDEDGDFPMASQYDDDDDSDALTLPTDGRRTQSYRTNLRKRTIAMDDSDDELAIGPVSKRARR